MPLLPMLQDLVVVFAVGAVAVVVFHRARLPPLVGYLLTGVVIGPYGAGIVGAAVEVQALAEIGVVLLLFTIGLQFSLRDLARLGRTVMAGGALQVGLTIALAAGLALAAGQAWPQAVFVGMLVAHSSSTLILRLLSHRGELDTLHARSALGVSLFQDLSVVPMVLVLPLLAGQQQDAGDVFVTLLKAVGFVAGALIAARRLVPAILARVVATGQREAFLLTVIVICLGAAWAAAAAGLSLALGAFLAGLIVSESEHSHQALGEILPLREIFISLFFISVGMLLDVRTVLGQPLGVAGVLTAVIALKFAVVFAALLALGHALRTAVLAGIALAQIGEFAFVLAAAAEPFGLLTGGRMQLFLAAAVGSMIAMPLLLAAGPRVERAAQRVVPGRIRRRTPHDAEAAAAKPALGDHVLIVGFGQNGRNLARVLATNDIPFVVVEMNPEVVRAERARGRRIIYGDATRPETLEHAGIGAARVLVIAISDAAGTRSTVAAARRLNPRLHLIVRTRYLAEIEQLRALGTDEVIAEEFEASIEIFSRVLQRYYVPRDAIEANVQAVRRDAYEMLRSPSELQVALDEAGTLFPGLGLDVVRVEDASEVAGLPLTDCELRERYGVTVVAIRSPGGGLIVNPHGRAVLEPRSEALLLGPHERLPEAARAFAHRTAGAPG